MNRRSFFNSLAGVAALVGLRKVAPAEPIADAVPANQSWEYWLTPSGGHTIHGCPACISGFDYVEKDGWHFLVATRNDPQP